MINLIKILKKAVGNMHEQKFKTINNGMTLTINSIKENHKDTEANMLQKSKVGSEGKRFS